MIRCTVNHPLTKCRCDLDISHTTMHEYTSDRGGIVIWLTAEEFKKLNESSQTRIRQVNFTNERTPC